MSKDNKTTMKVDSGTHKKLIRRISRMQIEKGKRVTIDEAIYDLLKENGGKMKCLECNWTGGKEKLTKNGGCPNCKSDKVIISLKEGGIL